MRMEAKQSRDRSEDAEREGAVPSVKLFHGRRAIRELPSAGIRENPRIKSSAGGVHG